jgi:hypothetical protein
VNEGIKIANRRATRAISITTNYTAFLLRVMYNQNAILDVD